MVSGMVGVAVAYFGWTEMSRWWEVKRGKPLDVMMWANSLSLASSE